MSAAAGTTAARRRPRRRPLALCGRTRSGKTTLLREAARTAGRQAVWCSAFDMSNELVEAIRRSVSEAGIRTELLGIDPDVLWVTVHETDDEAEQIWLDAVGVDPARIQRMGADNWWGPPGGPPGILAAQLAPEATVSPAAPPPMIPMS